MRIATRKTFSRISRGTCLPPPRVVFLSAFSRSGGTGNSFDIFSNLCSTPTPYWESPTVWQFQLQRIERFSEVPWLSVLVWTSDIASISENRSRMALEVDGFVRPSYQLASPSKIRILSGMIKCGGQTKKWTSCVKLGMTISGSGGEFPSRENWL